MLLFVWKLKRSETAMQNTPMDFAACAAAALAANTAPINLFQHQLLHQLHVNQRHLFQQQINNNNSSKQNSPSATSTNTLTSPSFTTQQQQSLGMTNSASVTSSSAASSPVVAASSIDSILGKLQS